MEATTILTRGESGCHLPSVRPQLVDALVGMGGSAFERSHEVNRRVVAVQIGINMAAGRPAKSIPANSQALRLMAHGPGPHAVLNVVIVHAHSAIGVEAAEQETAHKAVVERGGDTNSAWHWAALKRYPRMRLVGLSPIRCEVRG